MSDQRVSIREFLEDMHLVHKDDASFLDDARKQLEKSQLMEFMESICAEINREAGMMLVERQSYLPPEALVRSFTFTKGREEFVMQVEVWGPKPTLVFFRRMWREIPSNVLLRWVYDAARVESVVTEIKFASQIEHLNVATSEVERWFFYLLSGLRRAFAPSAAIPRNLVEDRPGRGWQTLDHSYGEIP